MTEQIVQETALIQVRPDADPRVLALYEESVKLLGYAEARTILSDDDVKVATEDLSVIAGVKKAIEAKRKEYTGPINEHLKATNGAFGTFTEPLTRADTLNRQKVLAYRAEQELVRQEQESINRLREEAARREMELKGEISEPVGLVQVAEEAPARYRTETGTLGTAKIKKWEVVDLKAVPIEYMMIDAAKVGKVVRAGIPNIPGIRIYEVENLRVTARKP